MLAKRQIPYIAPEAGTNNLSSVCTVCVSKNCIFVDINDLEGKQMCVCVLNSNLIFFKHCGSRFYRK